MSEQKINTFIFDCFGVILNPFIMGWFKDKRLKQGFTDENLESTLKEFDMGRMSEDDLLNYFLKYDGIDLSREQLRTEIDSHLDIDTGTVSIIQDLKQKGFKVALLSNANHAFFERKVFPTYSDFKNLFDEVVISSMVGMVKPNADIYLHTLQKLGAKPEEAIFIDDSEVNVKAANDLGIHGYLFTDSDSFSRYLKELSI